jgi:hypothetical protein
MNNLNRDVDNNIINELMPFFHVEKQRLTSKMDSFIVSNTLRILYGRFGYLIRELTDYIDE